jgi:hypothetical protein
MAPEPFVPVVPAPVNVRIVMEEFTLWESVAVTCTLESGAAENARQISEVPGRTLSLFTSTQVSPAPVTPVTVMFGDGVAASVATRARSNSLPDIVEKMGLVIEAA